VFFSFFFFFLMPFYRGMLNGSQWIEDIFAVALKERKKKKKTSSFFPLPALSVLRDGHERGAAIVPTAGHRRLSPDRGGSATSPSPPLPPPLSPPVSVIAAMRMKGMFLSTWRGGESLSGSFQPPLLPIEPK